MSEARPRSCVIIGAGPAGVSTAEGLREGGFTGAVTLLSAEPNLPYHRPELSKRVLVDEPPPSPTPIHGARFYRDHGIDLRLGTTATALAPDESVVHLDGGGSLAADTVVLATGGSPRPLDAPGSELPGVFFLRDAQDAAALRGELDRARRVVVIGGGFIGTEVAASAAARGRTTTVVEMADLPMRAALGRDVAARLAAAHQRRGVSLRCDAVVTRIDGTARVTGVRLADGSVLPADLVVIGVGTRPNSRLARESGLHVTDGIAADEAGRTSHPAVFAAGDAAAFQGPDGECVRTEHWQQARDSGATVARTILGLANVDAPPPWFWSDQFDITVQRAGRPDPTDMRSWRGEPDAESFSVLHHRDGVLTGIVAVNRGQDVRPAIELIKRGVPVDHDQLTDTGVPLRKLLKRTSAR